MKKYLLIGFLFVSVVASAQSWMWSNAGMNSSHAYCDPWAMCADNNGNIFETGIFNDTISFGKYSISTVGSTTAFLVKYNPSGKVLWTVAPTLYGENFSNGVAADAFGNSYITGNYRDTIQFGAYQLFGKTYPNKVVEAGSTFLVKYDSTGNVIWALSSEQPSVGSFSMSEAITVDLANNIYITGFYSDTISFGGSQLKVSDPLNAGMFLAKYSPIGSLIWVKGGELTCSAYKMSEFQQPSLCVDKENNIYFSGGFKDTLYFGGSLLNNGGVTGNFFLMKLDSSGTIHWETTGIGSSKIFFWEDPAGKIPCAVDAYNDVYIGGAFYDSIQIGNTILTTNSEKGIFLAKYDSSGKVLWAEGSTGAASNIYAAYGLSADKWGDLYFCGDFENTFMTFGGVTLNTSNTAPSFLFKIDSSGKVICSAQINNYNDDNNAIVADPLGINVYFSGDIDAQDVPKCVFGNDTLIGLNEYSFMAKWTCGGIEGINNIPEPNQTTILFPNPNKGVFTIKSSVDNRQSLVEVYNMLGEKVYTASLNPSNGGTLNSIDISNQPAGIYLYRVSSEEGQLISSGKFVIEK